MHIYKIKKLVFNYLTKQQKSDLCHYVSSFVKKHYKLDTHKILDMFIEDEKYYLGINSSRLPWMDEYIDTEEFLKELEQFIDASKKNCLYKESQRPIYEKQKALGKEQRKKAQEWKMSKERASKAQVKYYKALCKRHKVENPINLETASKLDLKNAISTLLEETHQDHKQELLEKLDKQ